MALLNFKVSNQKSLVLAEVSKVPPVMVIAGPNGVGKSTLLFAIKNGAGTVSPNTRMIYQGPHRVLRRTQVRRSWLGGNMRWFLDLLSGGDVSGYEGLSFPNASRTPDNVDEAGGTIKHTLGKIENRRQAVLAQLVDRHRASGAPLDPVALPDVYEPLKTLTKYLLPHLVFSRIDFQNEDNIRCVWSRSDASVSIDLDIDDLSSGEKSIVVLFLPLLEDQIRERLQLLETMALPGQQAPVPSEERVVLIDEPEQHLHPDLQAKILSYMRNVSRESRAQFVLTTHSPTILDQAYDDELFVLSNPSGDGAENQLRRIASNAERLEALKQLAGSTYFLTTGRAIVCIEGERDADPEEPTDLRLLEVMYPRATAVTLVPTTGKGNVITTVTRLREHVPEDVFRIRVRGLVDADQSTDEIPGVQPLPVCMIENFLLDPAILHEYVRSIEVSSFATIESVQAELARIVGDIRGEEVALRVRRRFKGWTVRIGGASVEQVKAEHVSALQRVQEMLPTEAEVKRHVDEVTAEVKRIITEGKALDKFRGKAILKRFYQAHVAPKGIGYAEMCLAVAKRAGGAGRVAAQLDPVFDRLVI